MDMRRINFRNDIQFESGYKEQVQHILMKYVFQQDQYKDMHEATDFIVVPGKIAIAVRVRRFEYYPNYRNEFTIRWARPSGVDTEIDKIRKGFADLFFYGFLNKEKSKIIQYVLIDLNIFRKCEGEPLRVIENENGSSDFAVYDFAQFPSNMFICYDGLDDGIDKLIMSDTTKGYNKEPHLADKMTKEKEEINKNNAGAKQLRQYDKIAHIESLKGLIRNEPDAYVDEDVPCIVWPGKKDIKSIGD